MNKKYALKGYYKKIKRLKKNQNHLRSDRELTMEEMISFFIEHRNLTMGLSLLMLRF